MSKLRISALPGREIRGKGKKKRRGRGGGTAGSGGQNGMQDDEGGGHEGENTFMS